ncbi:hypothetical protein ACPV5R_18615 [Vibrio astriarenae]
MTDNSIVTDIRINLDPDAAQNGTHGEVTVFLKVNGAQHKFTEWYVEDENRLEEVDTQVATGNSDGFDELWAALEDCSEIEEYGGELWDYISTSVNKLIACEVLNQRFNSALRDLEITQEHFCAECGVTRQAVSKWKKNGTYPKWVWLALKGLAD